jgi:Pyridoxal-phosphate dependent enzyme
MHWHLPTLADVLAARRRISPHLRPTPLYGYAALDEVLGAEVFVKHENHQPVGAFKVRGGVNLISQLRRTSAASSPPRPGNHGQSIAYAARLFGVRATICVPENANPVKVASMRGLGAELVFHGRDYDEAREHCEQLAREHGYRYVHSGNEPLLIAGVATETLEILEEQPEIVAGRGDRRLRPASASVDWSLARRPHASRRTPSGCAPVARQIAAMTSAARTCSPPGDTSSVATTVTRHHAASPHKPAGCSAGQYSRRSGSCCRTRQVDEVSASVS